MIAVRRSFEVWILLALVLMFLVLRSLFPGKGENWLGYIDWRSVVSLVGLLLVSTGVSESGYLSYVAHVIAGNSKTGRRLVFRLCLLSAVLGAFMTNDAAVMVAVPLTASLRGSIDVERAVALEVISANAGSTLTPIGNPQNLLIWHLWGVSFLSFSAAMVGAVLIQLISVGLLLLSVEKRPVGMIGGVPEVDERLKTVSIVMLVSLVVAMDLGMHWFVLVVLIFYALFYRNVLVKTNWMLIAIFILMFVDFRALASVFDHLVGASGKDVFLVSVFASQLFNNIPAAVMMTAVSDNYPAIAAGVNVGGNGLITSSFANLIAYGMVGEGNFLKKYHTLSFAFLIICVPLVYWLVF